MTLRSVGLFVVAALLEIGGAWLVWQTVREHRAWWVAGLGVIALGLYGFAAAFQPDAQFGRILAAYGGDLRRRLAGVGKWCSTATGPTASTSSALFCASSASR